MNNEGGRFDYRLIVFIGGIVLLIISFFVLGKGIGVKKDYNNLVNKLNREPVKSSYNVNERDTFKDNRVSGGKVEDKTEDEERVYYEFDAESEAMVNDYDKVISKLDDLFEIIYSFSDASEYASRRERAMPIVSEALLDGDYFKDGYDGSDKSVVTENRLKSEVLKSNYSFSKVTDTHFNILARVEIESSELDLDPVVNVRYFNILYSEETGKFERIQPVGIYEPNLRVEEN